MRNLSDNELDDLFKKAADGYSPDFNPADWEALASKLENETVSAPTQWSAGRITIVILLLLSVAYFTYRMLLPRNDSNVASNVTVEKVDESNTMDNGTTKDGSANAIIPDNNGSNNQLRSATNTSTNKNDVAVISQGTLRSPLKDSGETINTSDYNKNRPNVVDEQSVKQQRKVGKDADAKRISSQTSVGALQEKKDGEDKNLSVVKEDKTVSVESALGQETASLQQRTTQTDLKQGQVPVIVTNPDSIMRDARQRKDDMPNEEALSRIKDAREERAIHHRWAVKAMVSPDYSAVGFSSFEKPGLNAGVMVEYYLSNRISVATGAIWSTKVYTAADVEYGSYRASTARGDCKILDIPLMLYYHINPQNKWHLYAGAGLSSYLMNEEKYEFDVEGYYGKHTYSRHVKGENKELFEVVNVSIGVEKKITHRASVQIEPFLKMPMRGIGDVNLSLNSVGAFINLKYAFLKRTE